MAEKGECSFRTASIDAGEMTLWVNNWPRFLRSGASALPPKSCRDIRSPSRQLRATTRHCKSKRRMRPPTETAEQIEAPTVKSEPPCQCRLSGAEHVILQRDARKCEDWSGQHPALFKRYLGRLPKNLKPGATLHAANLRRAGAIDRLPLY